MEGKAGRRPARYRRVCTLLACIQNIAAVVGPQPTRAADWFQRQAALLLNCLYRRRPLPLDGFGSIYKSRVAQLWIDHTELADAINQVNARADQPVPVLS